MCCDKDETIRLLALYLRETQAQYNDCFSETHIMAEFDVTLTSKYITTNLNVLKAAAQDSQLELQRQAIDNLQKTIICKDLVYYSLLIKMQEFFRGRIGDVRLVRSKMDNLERSRKYLEDKCRRLKRLWREADRELRRIKCITSYDTDCQHSTEYKDSSTWTNDLEFTGSAEMEAKINFLLRENEDLKKQLRSRSLEMEIFDEEVKNQLNDNNLGPESADTRSKGNCSSNENVELEFVLKEHLACARILIEELLRAKERETSKIDSTTSNQTNINCTSINDQLYRKNLELDELFAEAKDKQEELGVLKDMRKQFEKSENLERMNDCLKKELFNLQRDAEKECCPREKVEDNANSQNIETDQSICSGNVKSRERGISSMEELKDQLSSTRELTEECLAELRVSKETLSFLRERISSLKKLLKEKSDEMVKLQADHQMIKNDCSILKSENRTFAEEARAEIQEFRDKLKALESELHLVDENYQRVSEDFDKSQKLLIDATNREVKLQHGLTAMEQIFYSKLSSAEREGKRLSDLVDNLRADLENARYELSTREEDYVEKCRDAYEQVESLEDQVALLEESKCLLTRQLQESRFENCRLMAENSRLMESGCKFVKELEDTQNALLELNSECKTKTRTLNSISAELNYVAASRSELCDESQRVVARIRSWIEEQRRLVESLSKKLKNEKNRIARYAFEKKALVATVNELTRVNGTLSEFSIGRKMCREHSPNLRYARSNGYETPASYKRAQKSVAASSTTVYTRPFKRRCVYSTKISRRTLLRGNSWWFPKLEHVSKELSRKNRRYEEKENEGSPSETSVDEARDFGYQSSASK